MSAIGPLPPMPFNLTSFPGWTLFSDAPGKNFAGVGLSIIVRGKPESGHKVYAMSEAEYAIAVAFVLTLYSM